MSDFSAKAKPLMIKAIDHLKTEFSKLRVGRASVAMLDGVKVEAYGNAMTLKEVAVLGSPDAKTITIQPWDRSLIGDIERGINAANLGLTPINDGKMVRINMPPLTEERRKEYVKKIKAMGEEAKVALRNVRRQILDDAKAAKSTMPEDESRRLQDEIQKMTDQYAKDVDQLVESKSKEITTL